MNSILQAEGLVRRFGAINAVDGVSLAIENGEFFALLGPSGCGKTTLLRLLAGFETPDQGRVLLDGKDITQLPPARRPLNLMFQSYALFPHMTVWQNIAYGLEMENCSKSEIESRVGEILQMTMLSELAPRKPAQLSGGQGQRVALARALVKRPRVLLLDEPLAALDKKLRTQMQLELKRMQHEIGISFVIVTHDQEEALVMADRIAVMDAGSIEQLGTPHELYEMPQNRFVAGFIGAMNSFQGKATEGGVEVDGLGLLRGNTVGNISPGDAAWITVRPERIRLSAEKPVDLDNSFEVEIQDSAYLGQDLKLQLKSTVNQISLEVRLTSEQAECARYQPGQKIWCGWRAQDASVLEH